MTGKTPKNNPSVEVSILNLSSHELSDLLVEAGVWNDPNIKAGSSAESLAAYAADEGWDIALIDQSNKRLEKELESLWITPAYWDGSAIKVKAQ